MMKEKRKEQVLELIDFGLTKEMTKRTILVIGVGGCGCYIASRMCAEHPDDVSYLLCESDYRAFVYSPVKDQLLLKDNNFGTHCDIERGKKMAQEASDKIQHLINEGTKMVFVLAGLGGGTGSGSSPVISGITRKMGILTIGIVTTPLLFENEAVLLCENKGLNDLRKTTDALISVSNDYIWSLDGKLSEDQAFDMADEILIKSMMTIVDLINSRSQEGINIDFNDVMFVLKDGGDSVVISGKAEGEKRVMEAIKEALSSPLLYNKALRTAKRILLHTSTSSQFPLEIRETEELTSFTKSLHPQVNIIWGSSTNESLERDVQVIIIASGLDKE